MPAKDDSASTRADRGGWGDIIVTVALAIGLLAIGALTVLGNTAGPEVIHIEVPAP